MKCKITILLLFLSLIGCRKKDIKFDKATWNEMDDILYANRELMVNDLMENHLYKGMSYQELTELIGSHENYGNMPKNVIGYEIMVDYGRDIDPVEGKTLYIKLTSDSTVIDYWLNHWGH